MVGDMTTRMGILTVANELIRNATINPRTVLPAHHCIVAEREDYDRDSVDWLIEGPHMPAVADGAYPPTVRLICSQHTQPKPRIVFRWEHLPGVEWEVPLPC